MPDRFELQHKTFEIKIAERRKDGGKIIINTGNLDRQRDRVLPIGVDANAYLLNPIVQWGHNYSEPWATVGKTTRIDVTDRSIVVDFELRPAANDQDPQNIVRLLWEGGWIKTASIGFLPLAGMPNDDGGYDFTKWELLEWSLVPVPANAEALRLAIKALDGESGVGSGESRAGLAPVVSINADAAPLLFSANGTTLAREVLIPGEPVPPELEARQDAEEMGAHLDAIAEDIGDVMAHLQAMRDMMGGNTTPGDENPPGTDGETPPAGEKSLTKSGRVLSSKNEHLIAQARDMLNEVLAEVQAPDAGDAPKAGGKDVSAEADMGDRPADGHAVAGMDTRPTANQYAITERDSAFKALCPFACGNSVSLYGWGMYSCAQCGGTFEVMPKDDDLRAHHFPEAGEVRAIEPGTIVKGVIPSHETPMADPDTAWDGPAVVASLPNDRATLRLVHAWVNSDGDPDAKQSYKLPHHLADGRVVLRGVNNAKARLPQSSIPQADHAGVERHLQRHQNQFEKAAVLRDYARALNEVAEELEGDTHLSDQDEEELVEELKQLINTVKEALK